MGPYPIFSCPRWQGLPEDLAALEDRIVSLALIADPLAAPDRATLSRWFPDLCEPFKEHFVVDLTQPRQQFVHTHHRRNARKALQHCEISVLTDPLAAHAEWVELYDALIRRHGITGIRAFSPESFLWQLQVPGMVVMRASVDGQVAGMVLWVRAGDVAYYHLAAYSEAGYQQRVSFALFWTALEHFSGEVRWLGLGAGAGISTEADDGLTRFKRGWATGTRTAYLCGRIMDPGRYKALAKTTGTSQSRYFPSYRSGEFA